MEEIWIPTAGYEGYLVSNLGRVKSTSRSVPRLFDGKSFSRKLSERIMKGCKTGRNRNYYKVSLYSGSKTFYQVSIHRLVAKAFIQCQRPEANQVNHKNGNGLDNRVENLEWVTNSENLLH